MNESRHRTVAHDAMMNVFGQADPHSMGVMKELQEVYPAFAKKLFHNNRFMQGLVQSYMNPMNILDYAVCGKCETLAPWDKMVVKNGKFHKTCTCLAIGCGARTVDPVTLREWMLYELKRRVKDPKFFAAIELSVDQVAMSFMRKAMRDYDRAENSIAAENAEKIGLHMADGSFHEVKPKPKQKHNIEFYEGSEDDIDEDISKLKKKLKG